MNTSVKTGPRIAAADIVVTDDDHNDQMLLALAADGQESVDLTFVDSGLALMELLRRRLESRELPDLIVLDLRMPVMDGHSVLEQLQRDEVFWQIPVVVFSTSYDPTDIKRSLFRGAVSYTTKPSEFNDLIEFAAGLAGRAVHDRYDYFDDVEIGVDWERLAWEAPPPTGGTGSVLRRPSI